MTQRNIRTSARKSRKSKSRKRPLSKLTVFVTLLIETERSRVLSEWGGLLRGGGQLLHARPQASSGITMSRSRHPETRRHGSIIEMMSSPGQARRASMSLYSHDDLFAWEGTMSKHRDTGKVIILSCGDSVSVCIRGASCSLPATKTII